MQGAGAHQHIHMKPMKLTSQIMFPHVGDCNQRNDPTTQGTSTGNPCQVLQSAAQHALATLHPSCLGMSDSSAQRHSFLIHLARLPNHGPIPVQMHRLVISRIPCTQMSVHIRQRSWQVRNVET
jgi:hypothetical protein